MNALKLESLGILAEGIAHDFNNILAGMLTNIQLAQIMSKEGKDIQGHLNDLEAALNKAAALTRQLMTFSKGAHLSRPALPFLNWCGRRPSLLCVAPISSVSMWLMMIYGQLRSTKTRSVK